MREFGDQGAETERVDTWRAEQECRVQKGITELHRTLDSTVKTGRRSDTSRQRSGTQEAQLHYGNQRDVSSGQNLGWKRKGQVGQTGATDFGFGVERFSGPRSKGK